MGTFRMLTSVSFPDIACASGELDPYLVESGTRQGDAAVCLSKSRRWKRTYHELAFMLEMASIHASSLHSITLDHIISGLSGNTHFWRVFWDWERRSAEIFSNKEGAQSWLKSEALLRHITFLIEP